jgi:glucose/arabinose dehydrogenase
VQRRPAPYIPREPRPVAGLAPEEFLAIPIGPTRTVLASQQGKTEEPGVTMSRQLFRLALAAACAAAAASQPASAQLRSTTFAQGFAQPLAFVQDPSDPTTQYVVEQGGRIRVVRSGGVLARDFLDLTAAISSGGERGLLGLAFPPDYATSGRFFVDFTDPVGDTVVARFTRSAPDRFVADAGSRLDFLWSTGERVIRQPFANHNGGNLAFGPDGFLYVGMGDGGSADDPGNRAQNPSTLLGKMLRIDAGVPDADTKGFRVPSDNPFLGALPVPALPEIWSFGLRNPWRFSFDDVAAGGTGALIIGDVGQGAFEEVDYEPHGRGGRNYGWRFMEGTHPDVQTLPPAYLPLTNPIFDYPHTVGISVIGGFVYRGHALGPAYVGRYFYADLNGRVWSVGLQVHPTTGEATVLNRVEHTAELGGTALESLASFGQDATGEIYLVSISTGRIVKLLPPAVPGDADGDGLPDAWELQYGLDPLSAAGDDGAGGDPDRDGVTNAQEFLAGTHPRGAIARYFAEGAVNAFFDTSFAIFNPDPVLAAHVQLRYLETDGTVATQALIALPLSRSTVNVKGVLPRADFATVIESDVAVAVDRTMRWDATGYGGHTETSLAGPALTWYLAEGATHTGLQLYYLLANPNASPAAVRISYLRPAPLAPIVKTYAVGSTSRRTIWVNGEDPGLAATDVSAIVEVTNGQPVVVERSLYLDTKGQFFGAGHGGAAVASLGTRWILPEGATGSYFSCYLLLANPRPDAASVTLDYLLPGGRVVTKSRTLPPRSRTTIFVAAEDPALASTSVSVEVNSTNGVPIMVERAMWWPGGPATWQEAHASAGSQETGVAWALADGEQGGAAAVQTYVLIANTGSAAGTARVTVFTEDGAAATKTVPLDPRSRTTLHMGSQFPATNGRRFATLVESVGASPVPVVVERAMYWDANGVTWAAGTSALGTKLR